MTDKPKFNKKLYRERVKQFKASFSQFIVEKKFLDPAPEPGSYVTWNQLELLGDCHNDG
ncbi:MAG TPA: hypothetical protein VNA15_08495 [Candidatus Angelobacter sp.]|nr:hypothetical protein [Candidatus Angelobacter sp.]